MSNALPPLMLKLNKLAASRPDDSASKSGRRASLLWESPRTIAAIRCASAWRNDSANSENWPTEERYSIAYRSGFRNTNASIAANRTTNPIKPQLTRRRRRFLDLVPIACCPSLVPLLELEVDERIVASLQVVDEAYRDQRVDGAPQRKRDVAPRAADGSLVLAQQKFGHMDRVQPDDERERLVTHDVVRMGVNHLPGHVERHVEAGSVEEHPSPCRDMEENKHSHDPVDEAAADRFDPPPAVQAERHPVHCLQHAVDAAPDDECPHRAVPQAGDEHRDDQVHVQPDAAFAVAAQSYVDIVPDPTG